MIVIDEPEFKYREGVGGNQFGGVCAAPIFQAIGLRALQYLGIPPDDPFGYPPGDSRSNLKKADWMNEVEELKILYNAWNRS